MTMSAEPTLVLRWRILSQRAFSGTQVVEIEVGQGGGDVAGRPLFYRAWGALLTWVNERRRIVPLFPAPTPGHPIEPAITNQLRKALWADDNLRERFLAEGAA